MIDVNDKLEFKNKLNIGECRVFKCREFKSVKYYLKKIVLYYSIIYRSVWYSLFTNEKDYSFKYASKLRLRGEKKKLSSYPSKKNLTTNTFCLS
jgi:hypothetical protein